MLCGQTLMGIITLAVFIMIVAILGINPVTSVIMAQGLDRFLFSFHIITTVTVGTRGQARLCASCSNRCIVY